MRHDIPLLFFGGALALACADRAPTAPRGAPEASPLAFSVVRTSVAFTVGPLDLSGIDFKFPGPNTHFRNALLSGPVTGDLTGTASLILNADLDGSWSGPAFGTMSIVTPDGTWQGTLTGHFLGELPVGILLTSQVVLHGPGQQLLTAECDEIPPPSSETLACSGETKDPRN